MEETKRNMLQKGLKKSSVETTKAASVLSEWFLNLLSKQVIRLSDDAALPLTLSFGHSVKVKGLENMFSSQAVR